MEANARAVALLRQQSRKGMKMIKTFRGTYYVARGAGCSRWFAFKMAIQNAFSPKAES
jgi:hypothetical protein